MNKTVVHLSVVHNYYDTRIVDKYAKQTAVNGFDTILYITHSEKGKHTIVKDGLTYKYIEKHGFLKRIFKNISVIGKVIKEKPNVIHFHDPELLPYFIAVKLLFKKTVIIFDMHENVSAQISDKEHIPFILRKPVSVVYRVIEKIGEKFLDKYVLAEDSYLSLIKNNDKALVVHNYPLFDKDEYMDFDFHLNPFRLVYIGSITKLRGLFEMIKATAVLHQKGYNISLTVIGGANPKNLVEEGYEFAIKHNLPKEKLTFTGPVENSKGMEVVSKCHLGLAILHPVPNYLESLPTKLFEYFKMGKPAIVSDFPLWEDIIKKAKGGFVVNPLECRELVEKIELFVKNRDLCKKSGQNAYCFTKENYSFESDFKQVLKIYEGNF
jgi:glycosyltransferase involved in cell wall biosynthesis